MKERFPQEGRVSLWLDEMTLTRLCKGWKIMPTKIELPGDINTSVTFNVGDLTPYIEDEDEGIEDLKVNPLQQEVIVEQAT